METWPLSPAVFCPVALNDSAGDLFIVDEAENRVREVDLLQQG